jgi:hypothetical protein
MPLVTRGPRSPDREPGPHCMIVGIGKGGLHVRAPTGYVVFAGPNWVA